MVICYEYKIAQRFNILSYRSCCSYLDTAINLFKFCTDHNPLTIQLLIGYFLLMLTPHNRIISSTTGIYFFSKTTFYIHCSVILTLMIAFYLEDTMLFYVGQYPSSDKGGQPKMTNFDRGTLFKSQNWE